MQHKPNDKLVCAKLVKCKHPTKYDLRQLHNCTNLARVYLIRTYEKDGFRIGVPIALCRKHQKEFDDRLKKLVVLETDKTPIIPYVPDCK